MINFYNEFLVPVNKILESKEFLNRDVNLKKKNKQLKYTENKWCDRFIKKEKKK